MKTRLYRFVTSDGSRVQIRVTDSAFKCEGFSGRRISGEGCSAWDVLDPRGFQIPGDMPRTLGHVAEIIAAARPSEGGR